MILHVLSDELDVSVLSRINYRLALTEDNCRLEVSRCSWLLILRLAVALVESFLEVSNLTVLSSELRILTVQVVAQIVDLSVQTVDLSLVANLCDSEVVCTVRVLELVNNTCVELEVSVVSIVANALLSALEVPNYCWLNIYLPCLVLAEVESEVKTSLRCQEVYLVSRIPRVCIVTIVILATEYVTPTKTINAAYLEETWLTFVTAEPVAEVDCSDKRGVD